MSLRFVVDASARSRLKITGPEGPAFVHRLSTQHVSDLKPGDARLIALTNDKGRLKDVLHHIVVDDGVLLVGTVLPGDDLLQWLDRYFFTEKLALENVAAGSACVVVDGATADALVAGASALGPWQAKSSADGSIVVARDYDLVDRDGSAVSSFVVVGFGAATLPGLPAVTTSAEVYAAMRLAAGVPAAEISEAHTPLDLDLHDAIHWAKGCYIGQEVIARLDTYGKQRKHLVSAVVGPGVVVGAEVSGAFAGVVTSVCAEAFGPGLPNALVLIKGDLPAGGAEVSVAGAPGRLLKRRTAQTPHD